MPPDIASQLTNLFKGFYCSLTQNHVILAGEAANHGDRKA